MVIGSIFIASGLYPILIGAGIVTPSSSGGTPPPGWVVTAAGLLFVFVGAAVIVDYAVAGGVGPDGDLPAGTPLFIRAAGFLVGLTIMELMTTVFGWVAFGPGPRAFATTLVLPFFVRHEVGDQLAGRIGFGIATLLLALMFVACGTVGVRRLVRTWRVQ